MSINSNKPNTYNSKISGLKLLIPAVLLLLLGIGNLAVGSTKADEYRKIIHQIEIETKPSELRKERSALERVAISSPKFKDAFQQQKRAKNKLNFYNFVILGAKLFLSAGALLFFISGLLIFLKPDKSSP